MDGKKILLFVYGTLRQTSSTGAHRQFLQDASFLGFARLQANLFRVSHYPAITLTDANRWVVGEIYQLRNPEQLDAVDAYEECKQPCHSAQEYRREKVSAKLQGTGKVLDVWAYLYNGPTENLEMIESGDFLEQ